jgi:hypothetical protein
MSDDDENTRGVMSPPPAIPRASWQNNNKNPAGGNDPPTARNTPQALVTLVMPLALLIVAKKNTERGVMNPPPALPLRALLTVREKQYLGGNEPPLRARALPVVLVAPLLLAHVLLGGAE